MRTKSLILFAISCISIAAANDFDDDILEDFSTVKGNGNYIVQLHPDTAIKSFVPRFLNGAIEVFSQSTLHHHLEVVKNKLIRRDTNEDQIHVFDAYNFGSSFKGITVKFEDLSIVKDLALLFTGEILKIIPDQDVQFELPTPANKKSIHKRYSKQIKAQNKVLRRGNYELLEEDDAFEAMSVKKTKKATKKAAKKTTKKTKNVKKVAKKTTKPKKKTVSIKKNASKKTNSKKQVVSMKNKKTTKKTTTKKQPNSKKHATTTKATTTKKGTKTQTASKETATATKRPSGSSDFLKQDKAEWNLVRVSERKRDLSLPYVYDSNAGNGAHVYVIDDGMNIDHEDFEGRASWGWSAFNGSSKLGEGHGTHVGGIIGGKTYGVAKKSSLIAVQVLNEHGKGSISSLLSGLQWVTTDAKKHKGSAVINMSLGMKTRGISSSALEALDKAVDAIVNSGVPLFVAAGNWGDVDACDVSPASNKNVYTVGATNKNDEMGDFSSYGKCIQILAPGEDIKSTYIESKTSTEVMTGTSMASPHVAGVAALLIGQMENPTPKNVYKEITNLSVSGKIKSISHNTINKFLFNGQKLTSA
ncbi:peptidase S8/S53 domain-containing protein [Sporodiniella umbellata]|nr:peptidase S8/S53 domain-containing protein [Sporodiniella umbellata]